MYLPIESRLLLFSDPGPPTRIIIELDGREFENCPLVGRLNRFSFSTSDRNGRCGVS